VLGTQETFCIVIAGLLERDSFDLLLPEFDKPWVSHLRETCCCSANLCTWRPNTVYKNIRVCRHQYEPYDKNCIFGNAVELTFSQQMQLQAEVENLPRPALKEYVCTMTKSYLTHMVGKLVRNLLIYYYALLPFYLTTIL
jgi:hypothetical protein